VIFRLGWGLGLGLWLWVELGEGEDYTRCLMVYMLLFSWAWWQHSSWGTATPMWLHRWSGHKAEEMRSRKTKPVWNFLFILQFSFMDKETSCLSTEAGSRLTITPFQPVLSPKGLTSVGVTQVMVLYQMVHPRRCQHSTGEERSLASSCQRVSTKAVSEAHGSSNLHIAIILTGSSCVAGLSWASWGLSTSLVHT
jgi:hypothetical protein